MTAGRSRDSGLRIILALAVILVLSLAVLSVLGPRRAGHRAARRAPSTGAGRSATAQTPDPRARPERDAAGTAGSVVRVAVVIDDVGFDESIALRFASLGVPLTFAILPHQPYSLTLASRLRKMGHEVILHLPMQPLAWPPRDPGRGAVVEGLSRDRIRAVVIDDLAGVPGAAGLNNHMGSRATADPALMRAVLEVAREQGLFFLDSRTTTESVAYGLAVEMGVPAVRRSVFLDDRRERSYIEAQVRSLLERARTEGSALAIGHPDPATLEALQGSAELLRSPDIRMVPASVLANAGVERAG